MILKDAQMLQTISESLRLSFSGLRINRLTKPRRISGRAFFMFSTLICTDGSEVLKSEDKNRLTSICLLAEFVFILFIPGVAHRVGHSWKW